MINQIIEQIKEIPGVRTAFQVDDRIVVDLEAGTGVYVPDTDIWYIYTGKGAKSTNLTIGKSYKVIGIRDRRTYESKTISIRDDKGIKKWYSPSFMERSFDHIKL